MEFNVRLARFWAHVRGRSCFWDKSRLTILMYYTIISDYSVAKYMCITASTLFFLVQNYNSWLLSIQIVRLLEGEYDHFRTLGDKFVTEEKVDFSSACYVHIVLFIVSDIYIFWPDWYCQWCLLAVLHFLWFSFSGSLYRFIPVFGSGRYGIRMA